MISCFKKPERHTHTKVLRTAISYGLLKLTEYSEYWEKRKGDICNYLHSRHSCRKTGFTEELVHKCFLLPSLEVGRC